MAGSPFEGESSLPARSRAARPNAARGRTIRLLSVFAIGVAALSMTMIAVAAGSVRTTIDWSDPDHRVEYPGGWSAAVCGPEVPIICVARHGVEVGIVEVGAYSLDGYDPPPDPRRPRSFLRARIEDANANNIEDAASVCGDDYVLSFDRARNRRVLGSKGVTYGFSGHFAGEPVSEQTVASLVVIGHHLVSVNASAHDDTSCYAGESNFTTADLEAFRPHLRSLVRSLPEPTFLYTRPAES